MIENRLITVEALFGKYALITKSNSSINIEELLHRLIDKMHKQSEADFTYTSREEILNWLEAIGVPELTVEIYWIASKEGIRISFEDFVTNYDEIWYPGADDILITDVEKKWVLKISHEEVFTFYFMLDVVVTSLTDNPPAVRSRTEEKTTKSNA